MAAGIHKVIIRYLSKIHSILNNFICTLYCNNLRLSRKQNKKY